MRRGTLADFTLNILDFWGPASNFGIPIAAVMDTQKDPEMYVHEQYAVLTLSRIGRIPATRSHRITKLTKDSTTVSPVP